MDSGAFAEWRAQSTSFLTGLLGAKHPYVESFNENVEKGYTGSAKAGIGILRAVLEDIESDTLGAGESQGEQDVITRVARICDRFHLAVRQLRSRHENRPTLDVRDEYDVQDLLHAILRLEFEDVRPEEYTPSYAGKSSRVDFLLKAEQTVIECKKSRLDLGAKEVGSELIEDIARYNAHPDCSSLVCFVYDPEGRIANPRGLEADLSSLGGEPRVVVLIRP